MLVLTNFDDLAFQNLKEAVSHPPVLALPDFSQPFLVECDALSYGIGAVLMKPVDQLLFIVKP